MNKHCIKKLLLTLTILLASSLAHSADSHDVANGHLNGLNSQNAPLYNPSTKEYLLYPYAEILEKPPKLLDVKVAIIDSGVDSTHPQLKGLVKKQKDFTGEGTQDVIGHGTLMAILTVADGHTNGMYPEILSAKVAKKNGEIDKQSVIKAIQWAVKEGADAINMSLSFEGPAADYDDLCQAMAKCEKQLFIISAGNSGPISNIYPAQCSLKNTLVVGEREGGNIVKSSGLGDVYFPGQAIVMPKADYDFQAARKLITGGNLPKALEILTRLSTKNDMPEAWFQLGMLHLFGAQPDLTRAYQDFEHAANKETYLKTLALMYMGWALFQKGDYEAARQYINKSLDRDSKNAYAHYMLGEIFAGLKQQDLALKEFEKARDLGLNSDALTEEINRLHQNLNPSK